MTDKIDHIVNKSFSNGEKESAPDFVWGRISDELTESSVVDQKVKASFNSGADSAPEMVWEKIQDQIDIDHVWMQIAKRLVLPKKMNVLKYAAAILILMLPFMLDYNNSEFNITSSEFENVASKESSTKAVLVGKVQHVNIPSKSASEKSTISSLHGFLNNRNIVNSSLNSVSGIQNSTSSINSLPSEPSVVNTLPMVPLSPILVTYQYDLDNSHASPLKPLLKRRLGITLGAVASIDNTWILNNETRRGFDSESLVENKLSFASSYGIFADVKFGRRYSLQPEYLFQSRTRQITQLYINGDYSKKEIEINSYKISLLLSRNFDPKIHGITHSTSLRLGAYLSGIKSNETKVNEILINKNDLYKRHNIGLRMEMGKKLYLRSWSFDVGLKGEYGFLNLASHTDKIPMKFNFTRELSLGAYFKFGYSF